MRECSPPQTCHVSHFTCLMSHVTCHNFVLLFFWTKWWSLSVEGLLSTGPTPSSFVSSEYWKQNITSKTIKAKSRIPVFDFTRSLQSLMLLFSIVLYPSWPKHKKSLLNHGFPFGCDSAVKFWRLVKDYHELRFII